MDPDQTLFELRSLATAIIDDARGVKLDSFSFDAVALAEKFTALDEWLKARGFLPADWAQPQPVAETPGNPFTSPSEEEMAEIEAAADRAWEAARAEGKITGVTQRTCPLCKFTMELEAGKVVQCPRCRRVVI